MKFEVRLSILKQSNGQRILVRPCLAAWGADCKRHSLAASCCREIRKLPSIIVVS